MPFEFWHTVGDSFKDICFDTFQLLKPDLNHFGKITTNFVLYDPVFNSGFKSPAAFRREYDQL